MSKRRKKTLFRKGAPEVKKKKSIHFGRQRPRPNNGDDSESYVTTANQDKKQRKNGDNAAKLTIAAVALATGV